MRNDKRLPDAELEVMQTIWSLGTQSRRRGAAARG